jgi:CRP/FNR family cyclic AMP-dependent transcriptional regulator
MQRTYQLSDMAPTKADADMAALLDRAGRRFRFDASAVVQQKGDRADGFWLIEAGNVSVCRFGAEGGVTIFAVLGPGDLFGELAHFTGVARQVDVVAETDVTMIRVDTSAINALLDAEPAFARWLLKSLAHQLRSALDRIDGDRTLSAEDRVKRLLKDMVTRDGPELHITQEALANYVGVSRVTMGAILNRLSRAGLIRLGYRQIYVTNPDALTWIEP